MSDSQNPSELTPAQRAFAAAAGSVKDGYVKALDRAIAAQRVHKAATHELNVAVAELRTFRVEIEEQVAA